MKYVSPICEMDKIETEDIMDISMGGIVPGAMFSRNTDAIITDPGVTNASEEDVTVGVDFEALMKGLSF